MMTNDDQENKKNIPITLMFQPTTYEVVSSDNFKEWERDLIEKVGLKADDAKKFGLRAAGTYCGCPNFDDCDAL